MSPTLRAVLAFLMVACSAKAPASRDSSHPPVDVIKPAKTDSPAEVPPPDPRETALSEITVQLVETQHLLRKPVDDDLSRAAFDSYLERVDGGKMFLLASDRDTLAALSDQIDDELKSGTLELAHQGAHIFADRVAVVEEMVAKLLAAPMDHTDAEDVELDPKKLAFAASEDELRDRWRRRLELEVMERVASMEARLTAAKDRKAAGGAGSGSAKAGSGKDAGSGAGAGSDDGEDDGDALALPVDQIPTTPDEREAKARADLAKTYASRFVRLRNPGPLDAASDLINGVTATLDPHSTYLPPADKANFDIQLTGSVEGIGASLREHDDLIEVIDLVPGGAAWRQGDLAAGDLIESVQSAGKDPVDVFDMRIDEVVKMIRGPKGTVVTLRVQKPTGEHKTISITRDVVVIEAAYAKGAVLSGKGKTRYGYINLPSFYGGDGDAQRTAADDVHRLLAELRKSKVDGLILDLRGNGGGILGDAVQLTGELIDHGPVVQVRDAKGKRDVLSDTEAGTDYDGPVVVLVDQFSASASEIVAGALQDYRRAIVVGTAPTHGKGTVQTLYDLDRATNGTLELGVMKLTIQQFFRVSGSSTQMEGVVPDILLPNPAGHLDTGERTLDHALPWSKTDPAEFQPLKVTWNAAELAKKSAARVGKEPVFVSMTKAVEILKARKDDTKMPLQRTAWDARRKQIKDELAAATLDLAKTTARMTVKPIEDPAATTVAPGPNGKTDDRVARWRDSLARDPWVEECVNILRDAGK